MHCELLQLNASRLRGAFLLLLTILVSLTFLRSEKDVMMTTIILINSEAVLVDLDERGEILNQHIRVSDYFTSSQSHETLVRRSINRMKGLSSADQKPQTVEPKGDSFEEVWASKRLKSSFTVCTAHYLVTGTECPAEDLTDQHDLRSNQAFVNSAGAAPGTPLSNQVERLDTWFFLPDRKARLKSPYLIT